MKARGGTLESSGNWRRDRPRACPVTQRDAIGKRCPAFWGLEVARSPLSATDCSTVGVVSRKCGCVGAAITGSATARVSARGKGGTRACGGPARGTSRRFADAGITPGYATLSCTPHELATHDQIHTERSDDDTDNS